MVHRKVFTPVESPETDELAELELAKLPEPETTDQAPPVAGVAASVVEEVQIAWFGPASGESGFESTTIDTSSNESAHVPLEIVQRKMVVPLDKPEIEVLGEVASVNDAEPEITVQSPVPESGILPARTEVVEQIV